MDRRIPVPCCLLLVTLIVLASAPPAHPWGAFRGVAGIKLTDTHQQIMTAAYALLMNDPRFTGMTGIPAPGGAIASIDGILVYEGVDGSLRTLGSIWSRPRRRGHHPLFLPLVQPPDRPRPRSRIRRRLVFALPPGATRRCGRRRGDTSRAWPGPRISCPTCSCPIISSASRPTRPIARIAVAKLHPARG